MLTLLAIRLSSILSMFQIHLNNLGSTLIANSSKNLFIPNSIHSCHSHHTSQTFHLQNIHYSPFCSSHTPRHCLNAVGTIICSYRHLYTQSYIAHRIFHGCPHLITSMHHMPFASYIRSHL